MRSIGQLLEEISLLRAQNEELRHEVQKLRANQPAYFSEDGLEDRWWFRKEIKPENERVKE